MGKPLGKIFAVLFIIILICALTVLTACSGEAAAPGSTSSGPASSATAAATTAASTTILATTPPVTTAKVTTAPQSSSTPGEVIKGDLAVVYGKADIDGKKDASWDSAAVAKLEYAKTGEPDADTKVDARMMWDENGFYFLFEITDSNISAKGGAGDWAVNDSIYLYIEENEESTESFETFAEGAYQFALIPDGAELIPRKGEALSDKNNVKFAYTKSNKGMILEFSYKPSYAVLKAGTNILVDFQYNDCTDGARTGALGWFNETDENALSELWGVAQLLNKGTKIN